VATGVPFPSLPPLPLVTQQHDELRLRLIPGIPLCLSARAGYRYRGEGSGAVLCVIRIDFMPGVGTFVAKGRLRTLGEVFRSGRDLGGRFRFSSEASV
jgi:hypothetical protein